MYSSNRYQGLQAARQIARQIADAVRAPRASSNTSGADAPTLAPFVPDVTTGVDENGVTTFDGLWDGDAWDSGATWAD